MSIINVNVTKIEREVTINATPNVTQIIVTTQSGGGIPDAPNNSNAYVRSALSWVIGYTKTAIDNLLNLKQNILVAGDNITIDNTDPLNPIISSTGGGGGSQNLSEVLAIGGRKVKGVGEIYTFVEEDKTKILVDALGEESYVLNANIFVDGDSIIIDRTARATEIPLTLASEVIIDNSSIFESINLQPNAVAIITRIGGNDGVSEIFSLTYQTSRISNRLTKVINDVSPYTIIVDDINKLLVIESEEDIVINDDIVELNNEFHLKNISGSTRGLLYDGTINFEGNSIIENQGYCILKCIDTTTNTWSVNTIIKNQNLEQVAKEGSETTIPLVVKEADNSRSTTLLPFGIGFNSDNGNNGFKLEAETPTGITGSGTAVLKDVGDATKTIAFIDDIPSVGDFVPYNGATQDVDLGENGLKAGQLTLDITPTGTAGVAVTRWNDTIGSSETTLKGGNVILKNGVDLVARVVNKVTPNTTLTKASYQVVRISGAQGQRLAVNLAQANNDNNSADTLGVVCETIATNQEGFIMTVGQLENINTTGSLQGETWVDGDVLYLSPTIAGRITNVKPVAPAHIVIIGYVEYAHANNGKIYVKVMNGWELDELHNVAISTPLNNQGLIYESATDLWKNRTIIQDSITDGVTTIAPSQNAVFDALNLKTDKTSWIDISATSTIVGWSSFTARFIFYKIIDGYCFIDFQLEGTSNSATTTFTMPFNSTSGFTEFRPSGYNVNNGSVRENAGRIGIVNNSNVVVLSASLNGNNYTASGIKASYGQISFKIN
jgi:nitrogen fixation protein